MRPGRRSATREYVPLCALAAAGLAPLPFAGSVPVLLALTVLGGLCFAPITAAQMGAIDEVAPEGNRTEAGAWLGTAYGAASAAGAALAGQLVDDVGLGAARALAVAGACASLVVAALVIRPVGDRPRHGL